MEYPKIQIATIEDLLEKKYPRIPPTLPPFEEAQLAKRTSIKNGKGMLDKAVMGS
jgi:hypothetical protein